MKFINPAVADTYQVCAGQHDTHIIIGALGWRSKLSRITPRIAAYMIEHGTNLISLRQQPKPDFNVVEAQLNTIPGNIHVDESTLLDLKLQAKWKKNITERTQQDSIKLFDQLVDQDPPPQPKRRKRNKQ